MGSLTITAVLDKTKGNGLSITVQNDDDSITQTIVMDGTSIITTVKGSDKTSTITQKKDSILIQCSDFQVQADTITCKSTKASVYQAEDTMTVKSTNALTVQSTSGAGTLQANGKLALTSDTANIEGGASAGDVKFSSINFEADANANATLKANANIDLEGQAQGTLKAAMVSVQGQAQVELKGPLSTVSGDGINTIKGGLIKIG